MTPELEDAINAAMGAAGYAPCAHVVAPIIDAALEDAAGKGWNKYPRIVADFKRTALLAAADDLEAWSKSPDLRGPGDPAYRYGVEDAAKRLRARANEGGRSE